MKPFENGNDRVIGLNRTRVSDFLSYLGTNLLSKFVLFKARVAVPLFLPKIVAVVHYNFLW